MYFTDDLNNDDYEIAVKVRKKFIFYIIVDQSFSVSFAAIYCVQYRKN